MNNNKKQERNETELLSDLMRLTISSDEFKTAFGRAIRRERELHHYSQLQLAKKVGVVKQTISKYEKGESIPDFQTALKLLKVLNISMKNILESSHQEYDRNYLKSEEVLKALSKYNFSDKDYEMIIYQIVFIGEKNK